MSRSFYNIFFGWFELFCSTSLYLNLAATFWDPASVKIGLVYTYWSFGTAAQIFKAPKDGNRHIVRFSEGFKVPNSH